MGAKFILNLWQSLPFPKLTPQAPGRKSVLHGAAKITEQKEFHRRLKYGFLGLTVPLSLGLHGLALPIVGMFSDGYSRSQVSQNKESEILIDVSVVEPTEVIKPSQTQPDVTENQSQQYTQSDDAIAALPASAVPLTPVPPAPTNPQNIGSTAPAAAATAGNLAPENQPNQTKPPATPTPVAPSAIPSFNPLVQQVLTSNSFSNNLVPAPPNVGGGNGTNSSLSPAGVGKTARGLGWGNAGNRNGNPWGNNSNFNGNQIGLFSGRLGIPWGRSAGNGNGGNQNGSQTGNQNDNQNGNRTQGSGGGRIRCQECGKPQYPDNARNRGLEGAATVAVDIAPDGSVTNVRIMQSSGHPELDAAAINAARGWRFEASATGKQGVPGRMNFQIEGSEYAQRSQQLREQQARESVPAAPVVNEPSNNASSVATQPKPNVTTPSNPKPSNSDSSTNPPVTQPPVVIPNSTNNNSNNSNSLPNNPTTAPSEVPKTSVPSPTAESVPPAPAPTANPDANLNTNSDSAPVTPPTAPEPAPEAAPSAAPVNPVNPASDTPKVTP